MLQAAADEGDDMGEKNTGDRCRGKVLPDWQLQLQRQRMVRQLRSLNRMRIRAGKSV